MLKITEARTLKKISSKILAEHLNIDETVLLTYEKGELKPTFKMIVKIADFLNVSVDELMGGPSIPKWKSVMYPALDSIPNVIPLNSITDIDCFEEEAQEISSINNYLALRINDDSMSPTLHKNDVIILRGDSSVDDDTIAVVIMDDTDALCRRIKRIDNGIALIPDNPCVKIMHFSNEDIRKKRIRILGKIIELRRPLP